jgi:hypothetical protein
MTTRNPLSRACLILASAIALVILFVPGIAFAQGDAEPTALDRLSNELLNVLIPVFVLFIGGLATWLLAKVQKKLGIEVGDKAADAWARLAKKGALRGAEWARKKAKDLTDGKKVPGPDVLETAANWAIDMGVAFKLPEIGREKLEGLIEAELFALRREELAPKADDPYAGPPPPRI